MSVACIALALVGLHAGFWTLLVLILLAGLGLGFILLNLTVFTQTLAERQFLGIATALTQSLRLVGGLLGTAAMGVLVKVLYVANLQSALPAAGQALALTRLADPQVLLRTPAHADAALLIARTALAQAVGTGLLICAGLGVLALFALHRLPRITLHQVPRAATPTKNSSEALAAEKQ
ncbi:Multidrug transporter [Pseudomonas caricapapayae]|uniref:Multidrug transporter n=1 Tax=Pseudomonas caricapapayae TaxID=46678 RepID=A0A3M3B557_9PSED|nr:Multidrug transporter [Pseudomonas caricapapayae]